MEKNVSKLMLLAAGVSLCAVSVWASQSIYLNMYRQGGDAALELSGEAHDISEVITSQEALDLLILFIQGLIVNAHDANPEALDFLNSLNDALAELVGSIVDVSLSAELNYDPADFSTEQEVVEFFQAHTTEAQIEKYYKERPEYRPLERREKAELVLSTFAHIASSVADVLASPDPKNPQVIGQAAGSVIGAIVGAVKESAHKNIIDGDEEYQLVSSYLLHDRDLREAVEGMLVEKVLDIRAGLL